MKKVMILVVSAVVIIAGGYFTMEYLNQKEKRRKVLEGTRGTSRKIHSLQYSRCTINYVYKI